MANMNRLQQPAAQRMVVHKHQRASWTVTARRWPAMLEGFARQLAENHPAPPQRA